MYPQPGDLPWELPCNCEVVELDGKTLVFVCCYCDTTIRKEGEFDGRV